MNRPRRATGREHHRALKWKQPTRENGGVLFGDAGAPVPSPAKQISATLALIEARRLVNAARLDFLSEADLAPSLLRYVDGVALELATLRADLERANDGEGSGF